MPSTFATRLINLRKSTGLKQAELSKICGLNPSHISKFESPNGKEMLPSATVLVKLADALNTSTDYLLKGKELESENDELCELFLRVQALPNREQKAVTAMLEAYLKAMEDSNRS